MFSAHTTTQPPRRLCVVLTPRLIDINNNSRGKRDCVALTDELQMVSIWDLCVLDVEQENCVKIIKANTKLSAADNTAAHAINAPATGAGDQTSSEIDPMVAYSQRNLSATEQSCQAFVRDLDGMISMLDDITAAHIDVTGRTNSLMRNCEDLLERQVIRAVRSCPGVAAHYCLDRNRCKIPSVSYRTQSNHSKTWKTRQLCSAFLRMRTDCRSRGDPTAVSIFGARNSNSCCQRYPTAFSFCARTRRSKTARGTDDGW